MNRLVLISVVLAGCVARVDEATSESDSTLAIRYEVCDYKCLCESGKTGTVEAVQKGSGQEACDTYCGDGTNGYLRIEDSCTWVEVTSLDAQLDELQVD
jgi:hypothetical protein